MARKKQTGPKRQVRFDDDWASDDGGLALTAPIANHPDTNMSRTMRFFRRYVWLAVFITPPLLAGVIMISIPSGAEEPGGDDTAVSVAAAWDRTPEGSAAQAVAQTYLESWMNADPMPVPAGTVVVSWNGSAPMAAVSPATIKDASGKEKPVEMDSLHFQRFTLRSPNGQMWSASVPIATSIDQGVMVADVPSLVAVVPSGEGMWAGQQWPGERTVSVTDPVANAVRLWAEKYVSNDPVALAQIVGDPNPDHAYMPLPGATLVSATATKAVVQSRDLVLDEGGVAPNNPGRMVVRVALVVTWDGQNVKDVTRLPAQSLDVLIEKADTASPIVTSWGPAGSAETLDTYSVAITGRAIAAPAEEPGESSETGSAASEETPKQPVEPDGAESGASEEGAEN